MKLISFRDYKRLIFSIFISVLILLFCYGILQLIAAFENKTDDWETVNLEMEAAINQPEEKFEADTHASIENEKVSSDETELQLLVNLNKAGVIELEKLPGIGPVKAKAIIDYRVTYGYFQTIEEVTRVNGIGPVTFENMAEFITIDD